MVTLFDWAFKNSDAEGEEPLCVPIPNTLKSTLGGY